MEERFVFCSYFFSKVILSYIHRFSFVSKENPTACDHLLLLPCTRNCDKNHSSGWLKMHTKLEETLAQETQRHHPLGILFISSSGGRKTVIKDNECSRIDHWKLPQGELGA